jgi:hypothetical protein
MAATPTLKDKIDHVAQGYHKSVFTLQSFVASMNASLESQVAEKLQGIEDWFVLVNNTPLPSSVEAQQPPVNLAPFYRKVYEDSQRMFKRYPEILYEMAFIYRIALFDAYLSDVLLALLCSHPEMLKSKKTLTHEEVIDAPDKGSLIRLMADKALSSVSRESITGMSDWIRAHMNIELFNTDQQRETVVELMARRNLFVHANGFVNSQYLSAVPDSTAKSGERLFVDDAYWRKIDAELITVAETLRFNINYKFS